MPDARFFRTLESVSVGRAIELCGGRLVDGSPEGTISRVCDTSEKDLIGAALFCGDQERAESLAGRAYGLCFTTEKLSDEIWRGGAIVVAKSPRLCFARICAQLYEPLELTRVRRATAGGTIDETAKISADASIGDGALIGPYSVIGPGVEIGSGARIGAHVSIMNSIIGRNVDILEGARIGQAGFGFELGDAGLERVPQLGRVIIGDDVDIGANTTIDRGALRDTIIGNGVKIDNLVQIGHNVEIGDHSVIAAQTGISGSCVIGKGVFMGGKVGMTDHLKIGDGAQLAAGTGLMRDVPAGEKWGGRPGKPVRDWLKETAVLAKLAKKKAD